LGLRAVFLAVVDLLPVLAFLTFAGADFGHTREGFFLMASTVCGVRSSKDKVSFQ